MEGITVSCGRGQVCDEESKMCVKGAKKPKPDSKVRQLKKDDKEEAASKKGAIEEESAASNQSAARMAPVEPSVKEESSKPDPTGKDMKSFSLDDNEERSGQDFDMDYSSAASGNEGTGDGLDDAEPSETPKRSESDDEMKPESDGSTKWTPDVETTTEPNDETKPESDDKVKDPPGRAEEESTETALEYPDRRSDSKDEPSPPQDGASGPDDPKNRKKGDLSKEEVEHLLKLELNEGEKAKSPDGSKEKETKTVINEVVAETSSKEVVEVLKEKTEEEVDLKEEEVDLKQDNDLSIYQKEKTSELIWDLESDERSEEDKISEEIGQVRRKLQKLREDLDKAKEEDNKTVKDFQEEIEWRQIHDLSEKRDEIMKNKEEREAVKDERSESVISEEIGEVRQELEHSREDLVQEKKKGFKDIIEEIKSEIVTKFKEIHCLSGERDRMKEEKKQETGENENDGISDQKKVDAAEETEEEADVVLKGADGVKFYDVVSSDSDDSLILVEKEADDHDPKKPIVLVTSKSDRSELISAKGSSPGLDEILEKAKQSDNTVIKKSKGSSVKIYPSWEKYIQEQLMQVTGNGDESHLAGKDHKLGGQLQTKSGASQIVAVTEPDEELDGIEEDDGSQVVVKETPLSGNQAIDSDSQPVPGQAPPESIVVPPSSDPTSSDPTPLVAVQPSPGQAKAAVTPDHTAVQHQSADGMPLRRPWWRQPGLVMADFDDYGVSDYDYGGFDDYEMAPPPRSRRRRRRWNRRRNMRGRGMGRRRSSRRSIRQPRDGWERKFYSILKDHFFDDDEIEFEAQKKMVKKVGARKGLKSTPKKPKYDRRMDSVLNPQDDLGIWTADPIMKKEKITPESLGQLAADELVAVQEKITLADLGPWASDDTVAEEPKITPAVLGPWAADPDTKSAKLGTWANDVELMVDEDVDVPAYDKEEEEEYFFDVENERGQILKEPQNRNTLHWTKKWNRYGNPGQNF